jgi:septal ring-binding cell division protein DamX
MDCPTCGAPAQRGQLVCLECGSRIALTYRRPPSWKLPVAIIALVSLLGLGGALAVLDAVDDDARQEVADARLQPEKRKATQTETERTETKNERTDAETERKPRTEKEPKKTAAKPEPKPKPKPKTEPEPAAGGLTRSGDLFRWPRTLKGFTVVVLSAEDRASATAFARRVAQARDAKAGVIRSNDFRTLPKGFFVVFAGSYPSRARADRAAARLGRKYPGAFPQRVSR